MLKKWANLWGDGVIWGDVLPLSVGNSQMIFTHVEAGTSPQVTPSPHSRRLVVGGG